MIRFTTKNCFIVTGASSGIGKAITLKILELGGSVVAIARNSEKLHDLYNECEFSSNIIIEPYDLAKNPDEIPQLLRQISHRVGTLNGLVHSAGSSNLLPIQSITKKKGEAIFDINFWAALMLAKGFSDKRVSKETHTSIVIISSIASIVGAKARTVYSSSKGSINSMILSLAMELSKMKIRVNTILPGYIQTEMAEKEKEKYSDEFKNEIDYMYPLGKGSPQDIANLCIFLLSNYSKWITGQNIVVDGGRTLW